MSAQPAMSAPPPASSSPVAGVPAPLQNGVSAAVSPSQPAAAPSATTAAAADPAAATAPGSAPTINPNQYGIHYIAPLAKHEDIVNEAELFWDTLKKCHAAYRTKFSIPKIGGKELDLHKLYVEVTARGGLEKVTKERKWKGITVAFSLPRTTTSASYVLRRYYNSLLLRYEEIHFLGKTGPVGVSVDMTTPGSVPLDLGLTYPASEGLEAPVKKTRKRKSLASQEPLFDPASSIGSAVTGAIDGKFENGYLVTVHVGEEKLNGVLYHVPQNSKAAQFASLPHLMNSITADTNGQGPEVRTRRKRRRKDEMPKKDPDAPRPNRTGYNFFFAEKRAELKLEHPTKDREISRMIGHLWNNMTEGEKWPWQERGIKDKERFRVEMRNYRERSRNQTENGGCAGSDAVAEAPGENDHGTDGDASQDYQGGTDAEVDPLSAAVEAEQVELACNATVSEEVQEEEQREVGSAAGSPEQYELQGHEQAMAIFDSKEIMAADSMMSE